MDDDLTDRFAQHALDWFKENKLKPHEICGLLANLLTGLAAWYDYPQNQFDEQMEVLKIRFTHCKKARKVFRADKSKIDMNL
jgi:hypothetical protein